ncbi:hypothetical protein KAJ87_03525 [Candidatus Pacearchaeota archaeon]|nr:hypothetical protein [Candidatus Pacearchaeota archaeon]
MSEENKESHIEDSKVEDSKIQNSNIEGSKIESSQIIDSSVEESQIKDSKIFNQHIVKNHKEKFSYYKDKFLEIAKTKKFQIIVVAVLLLAIIILSSSIRLSNLPLLKDSTTGEYLPLALDPFYFLRIAELQLEGPLPIADVMRYPSLQVEFTKEISSSAILLLYKIGKIFDKDITLRFMDVISPVIFFILGLVSFFFLILLLTASKATALISSFFLAIVAPYLYRTMAGFSDHESIGMFAFFLSMLIYVLAIKSLGGKNEKTN